jgi:hypothetical protein
MRRCRRSDLRKYLLLPDHEAERGAGELVGLAQLILQIFQVGRGDVFRMADKHREDRWFGRATFPFTVPCYRLAFWGIWA